jgi:hypothetical protein
MRLKSELYYTEQSIIQNKLYNILNLNKNDNDNDNYVILYYLDNDNYKQKQILDLIPEIRKYYNFSKIPGAYYSNNRIVRPWLSIIKYLTKKQFTISSSEFRIKINDKVIRTKKYLFIKK